MDLKEYTIIIASKGDKSVKYDGGSFIVREITDSNNKKYSIPKLKKDGSVTVAYKQSEKVEVGHSVTVGVDEQEKSFTQDGKTHQYIKRTIRMIKGDEHGTPHTNQSVPNPSLADLTERIVRIEEALFKDEAPPLQEAETINVDEIPF